MSERKYVIIKDEDTRNGNVVTVLRSGATTDTDEEIRQWPYPAEVTADPSISEHDHWFGDREDRGGFGCEVIFYVRVQDDSSRPAWRQVSEFTCRHPQMGGYNPDADED